MKEVTRFSLPFRHFGVAAYMRRVQLTGQGEGRGEGEGEAAMQKQLDQLEKAQLAEAAKARGVLPVRVEMPIVGEIYRFEKFLVIDEAPKTKILYRTIKG